MEGELPNCQLFRQGPKEVGFQHSPLPLRHRARRAGHLGNGCVGRQNVVLSRRWGLLEAGLGDEKSLYQKQTSAKDETAIGNVEYGPVKPQVAVQEIADAVEHKPVVEVTQGASED